MLPPRWRRLAAAIGAALVLLAGAARATADADMISADPAPGSTVSGSPVSIRLGFSQPLQNTSRINLFSGQFQAVPGVTTLVAGSELQANLAQPLAPAVYTVDWMADTDDGHSTQGSYQFAVTAASSPFAGRLVPLAAGTVIIVGLALAAVLWNLNRRRRV